MVMVMIKSSYQFDLNETPTVHSGWNTKLEFRPFLGFNCLVLFVFDCCLQRESESGDFSNEIGRLACGLHLEILLGPFLPDAQHLDRWESVSERIEGELLGRSILSLSYTIPGLGPNCSPNVDYHADGLHRDRWEAELKRVDGNCWN